jgi:hypothetical protein
VSTTAPASHSHRFTSNSKVADACGVTDAGIKVLAQKCPNLKKVSFPGSDLGNDALIHFLHYCKDLTHLDFLGETSRQLGSTSWPSIRIGQTSWRNYVSKTVRTTRTTYKVWERLEEHDLNFQLSRSQLLNSRKMGGGRWRCIMRRTRTGGRYRTRYQETNALACSLQLLAVARHQRLQPIRSNTTSSKPSAFNLKYASSLNITRSFPNLYIQFTENKCCIESFRRVAARGCIIWNSSPRIRMSIIWPLVPPFLQQQTEDHASDSHQKEEKEWYSLSATVQNRPRSSRY